MNKNRNIFAELASYEKIPNKKVWNTIANELYRNNNRKIVFWRTLNTNQIAAIVFSFFATIGLCSWFYFHSTPFFNSITYLHSFEYTQPQLLDNLGTSQKSKIAKPAFQFNSIASSKTENTNLVHLNSKHKLQNNLKLQDKSNSIESNNEASITSNIVVEANTPIVQKNEMEFLQPIAPKLLYIENHYSNNSLISYSPPSIVTLESTQLFIENNIPIGVYATPIFGGNMSFISFNNNSKNLFFDNNTQFGSHMGYTIGLQLGYQFSNKFALESGAFLSQYIQYFKNSKPNTIQNGQLYLDQLEIPLSIRYLLVRTKNNHPLYIYLKGGLLYGSVLNYQVNFTELNTAQNIYKTYNYDTDKQNFNSLQLGYTFGADLDYYFKNRMAFSFSSTNSYMSNISNFPHFRTSSHPSIFSISFSAGVKLNF